MGENVLLTTACSINYINYSPNNIILNEKYNLIHIFKVQIQYNIYLYVVYITKK